MSGAETTPEPRAERMPWPGYTPTEAEARLLRWGWAVERLQRSRRFWLATAGPEGSPHLAAIWAVWTGDALAFSTGRQTRKARNLAVRPRCTVSTESGGEAVVVEGVAGEVTDPERLARIDDDYTAKYASSMLVPDSPVFAVRPLLVSGIVDSNGFVLPTRWRLASR